MFGNKMVSLGLVMALLIPASLAIAQKKASMDDLKKEIQALGESVKAMQKDLQEIKALLTTKAPAAPPENVLLDLGSSPSRGERSAKLVLIEFSDYQ